MIPENIFALYRHLPSHKADRMMGIGVSRRFVEKAHDQVNQNIHSAYVIVVVLEGKGFFTGHNGQRQELTEGYGFQRIPGLNHRFEIPKQQWYSEFFIHLPKSVYENLREYGFANEKNEVIKVDALTSVLQQVYQMAERLEKCHDIYLPSSLLEVGSFAFELLRKSKELNIPSLHQTMIVKACEILSQNFDKEVLLPELAGSFHLSYERFRKIFREVMGIAPGDYRIRAKIQVAQNMLLERKLNVNEIAYQLGYPDVFTFSKQFKKIVGCSPTNFLKRLISRSR